MRLTKRLLEDNDITYWTEEVLEEEFRDMINHNNHVCIEGLSYNPAWALMQLDECAYRTLLNDYLSNLSQVEVEGGEIVYLEEHLDEINLLHEHTEDENDTEEEC